MHIRSRGLDVSFKPLSDALLNCITIEEIFEIKSLLKKQYIIEELLEKHHLTLPVLFLSLSYEVIPI